jgi:hypothetical protein
VNDLKERNKDSSLGSVRRAAEQQSAERERGLGRIREAFLRRDEAEQRPKRRWLVDVASGKAPLPGRRAED